MVEGGVWNGGLRVEDGVCSVQGAGFGGHTTTTNLHARGGLVIQAHRLVHLSTLGLKIMKKRRPLGSVTRGATFHLFFFFTLVQVLEGP